VGVKSGSSPAAKSYCGACGHQKVNHGGFKGCCQAANCFCNGYTKV
jgi:hypothetical protein